MGGRIAVRNAAHQQDRFRQHQLRDAARVGKGRVENRDAAVLRDVEIHLVGADAETADGHQLGSILQHSSRELGRRTDAHDIGVRVPRSARPPAAICVRPIWV